MTTPSMPEPAGTTGRPYLPDLSWVRLRLEEANEAYGKGDTDRADRAIRLAESIMHYLDCEYRAEAQPC